MKKEECRMKKKPALSARQIFISAFFIRPSAFFK